MIINESVRKFIEEQESQLGPKNVVIVDGSTEQLELLRQEACTSGELIKLNQENQPGCYLHRSNPNDVARVEDRTFICCEDEVNAGLTNNWLNPKQAYDLLTKITKNSYNGKTMYVIPYSMGEVGGKFSKIGIEITDSIYVVLNMSIMTRVGTKVLEELGESTNWVKGIHASCNLNAEERYICHFPQDNTIISVNSAYGGNALLGKKCFSLRIASNLARQEGWLAEHMLILGIERPAAETKYIAAAFPSACGKTNLAMLIPPEIYKKKGYKIFCVGDDIAWLHIGDDGRLWAINPENGFFGVAPGTNEKTNPNALSTMRQNTIFTNVALNLDDNTVWWEGLTKNPPENAIDWKGEPWNGKTSNTKGAHPNSRFTAPLENCPCYDHEHSSKNGVPISAIVFGGRRATTVPLVCQAKNFNHGVFMGSIMASETTAAASGKIGSLRRDPMAMLPFCGYNVCDYFSHWIEMGKKLGKNAPKIFNVNWFRTDEAGNFIWPGFGENLRVLDWVLSRCEEKVAARETAFGYIPFLNDLELEGLNLNTDNFNKLLKIDTALWQKEVESIDEFYKKLKNVPQILQNELAMLKEQLQMKK